MDKDIYNIISKTLSVVLDPSNRKEYTPWFWKYHGNLVHPKAVLSIIQEFKDNFSLAKIDPQNKIILDAGCGFGIVTLIIRMMGAKEIHGIDLYQPMMETFNKIIRHLPEIEGVFPKYGDVINTGYKNDYFDFILSNEAISHYYDIPNFLKEMWRVLKPGGILFISDGNNGANVYRRLQTYRIWDRFENGPSGYVVQHEVGTPYHAIRAQIIRESFPILGEKEIELIAKGTFGYCKNEIIKAGREFLQNGIEPESTYKFGNPPIDPNTCMYIERIIDPWWLKKELKKSGYSAKIFAYFGGAGGNKIIRTVNSVIQSLSPISWPFGRALKVVARKPKS
jgi:SAM-dependent methyltransferase